MLKNDIRDVFSPMTFWLFVDSADYGDFADFADSGDVAASVDFADYAVSAYFADVLMLLILLIVARPPLSIIFGILEVACFSKI